MDEKQIYKKIKDIAEDLCRNGQTFTRADLAYELKDLGIDEDSSEVSRLVYEAYLANRKNKNIAVAFKSNDNCSTVVSEFEINHLIEEGSAQDAVKMAEQELHDTKNTLNTLQKKIADNTNGVVVENNAGFVDFVMGTKGAKDVSSTAGALYKKYSQMVEYYHYSENCVRGNISDFMTLRGEISSTYQKYADMLIDVYGDSIKMIEPKLFDFDKIEWLDVDKMLKDSELEYNLIADKCKELISEISEDFKASIQESVNGYRSVANSSKAAGLALAGLAMFNHYAAAAERTNNLKNELVTFKTSICHDVLTIKADLARLLIIHKSLQDVVIPKSSVYLRYCDQLLSSDINAITKSMYEDENIRPLVEQKQKLVEERNIITTDINDHLQNIDIYNSVVTNLKSSVESKKDEYDEAKAMRPVKPSFILNLLTFGTKMRNFNREMYDWDKMCSPVIRAYEDLMIDLKMNQDEQASHKKALAECKKEHKEYTKEIDKINKQIRSRINVSPDVKMKMLKHVRTMVTMLRLAREIAESKIDEKFHKTVRISDESETTLPAEMESNITMFTNILAENLHISPESTANALKGIAVEIGDNGEIGEQEVAIVSDAANESLQRGISLFDSWMRLQQKEKEGRIATVKYEKEYDKIMSSFKQTIDKIDDKSAYLREVMKKVNLSETEDERKEAMALLSDLGGFKISESDFNEFINGKFNIEL